jgi:membrane peptidoglycan carboxypeptidase
VAASSRRPPAAVTVLKLIGVLVAAGLLAAGLALPYVGGMGLVARQQSQKFLNTPCTLTETAPPQKTVLYAKDGRTRIATLFYQDRTPVSLTRVPKYMVQALIATEDRRFYSHHGVDMRGLLRGALNTTSGDTQGGSTLTMQYVKQVRLYQAGDDVAKQQAAIDQTINRKIQDANCAIQLEKTNTKNQILEKYLNIAFFGENSYGIGTAAKTYFNQDDVSKLTLPQAALLIGLVRAPSLYDPFVNPKGAKARRDQVIQNLVDVGNITAAQAAKYEATPIRLGTLSPPVVRQGCAGTANADKQIKNVGFFCDWAVDWLENVGGIPATQLNTGGLKITTTLDPNLQNSLQTALWGPNGIPAASPSTALMPVIDPHTGDVLAMATSKHYGLPTSPADTTHTTIPMFTQAIASGASTYKLFSVLAALTAGIDANVQLGTATSAKVYRSSNCPSNPQVENDPNTPNFFQNETLASATAKSSNTYFLQLADDLFGCDLDPIVHMAEKLSMSELGRPIKPGSKTTVGQNIITNSYTSFLIGSGVSTVPLELTNAYAAIADDGVLHAPNPIVSVTDLNNRPVLYKHAAPARAVVTPYVAREAVDILVPDTQSGTSAPAFGGYYGQGGSFVAGKTGTNNATDAHGRELDSNSSLWFVGATPNLVATTAIVSLTSPSSPLAGLPGFVDPAHQAYGSYAAQQWVNALTPTLRAQPWSWPPDPRGVPDGVPLPDLRGQTVDQAKATVEGLGLKLAPLAAGISCGSTYTYGTVGWFSPQVAAPNSTVTYCPSSQLPLRIYQPPPPPRPVPRPRVTPPGPPRRTR